MKSVQKNNSATNVDHSPFINKGNYFFGKKNLSFFNKTTLQTKLSVNEPNDMYEKEADAMADNVVRRLDNYSFADAGNSPSHFFNKPPSLQRKCASCEQEEKLQKKEDDDKKAMLQNKLQKKPIFESNAELPDDSLSFVQRTPFGGTGRGEVLQRKCANCEEEEKLQKKPDLTSQTASSNIESQLNSSGRSGNHMPAALREQMESSFDADFSDVKIHNDSTSVQMNKDLNAQAFTRGRDIYFNSGKYNSNNREGRHLLAHELTHVVQQSGEKNIQRQEETTPDTTTATNTQGRFLTDDSATPGEGQMTKSAFLQRLNTEVCATVDEALRSTGSSSDNCPYIREVFARYQNNTPARIEQVLQRYEPSTQSAQSADDLIQMIKAHAFTAAIQWATNGTLPGLSQGIAGEISAGVSSVSNAISTVTTGISNTVSSIGSGISSAVSGIGSLFFKSKAGGNQVTQSPQGVMQSLGKGNSLSSDTKGRMESAFGTNFSDVQIHTDSKASGLSNSMNARAFTVGNHIAFGSGEHKPGTLIGDALMAHELAHVEQQRGMAGNINVEDQLLEQEANQAASGVLLAQYDQKNKGRKIQTKSMGGLKIQRCAGSKAVAKPPVLAPTTVPTQSVDSPKAGQLGLPILIEVLAETTCDPDQGGKVIGKIKTESIPQCMYECVVAHEEAHVKFGQDKCVKVAEAWTAVKLAQNKVDKAIEKAKQSGSEPDMTAAEQALKELQTATTAFDKAVKDYESWFHASCRENEKQAYQAGIDKCKTNAVQDQCAELKITDKYTKMMSDWEQYKNNPPNCK